MAEMLNVVKRTQYEMRIHAEVRRTIQKQKGKNNNDKHNNVKKKNQSNEIRWIKHKTVACLHSNNVVVVVVVFFWRYRKTVLRELNKRNRVKRQRVAKQRKRNESQSNGKETDCRCMRENCKLKRRITNNLLYAATNISNAIAEKCSIAKFIYLVFSRAGKRGRNVQWCISLDPYHPAIYEMLWNKPNNIEKWINNHISCENFVFAISAFTFAVTVNFNQHLKTKCNENDLNWLKKTDSEGGQEKEN